MSRVPKVWESLPLARFSESDNQAVIKARILAFIEIKKKYTGFKLFYILLRCIK